LLNILAGAEVVAAVVPEEPEGTAADKEGVTGAAEIVIGMLTFV
jgi:hypothetical protein